VRRGSADGHRALARLVVAEIGSHPVRFVHVSARLGVEERLRRVHKEQTGVGHVDAPSAVHFLIADRLAVEATEIDARP
jgi:hypothetical protein